MTVSLRANISEVKDEVIRDMIKSCERRIKKYGYRKMTTKELDKLCGI